MCPWTRLIELTPYLLYKVSSCYMLYTHFLTSNVVIPYHISVHVASRAAASLIAEARSIEVLAIFTVAASCCMTTNSNAELFFTNTILLQRLAIVWTV